MRILGSGNVLHINVFTDVWTSVKLLIENRKCINYVGQMKQSEIIMRDQLVYILSVPGSQSGNRDDA